MSTARRRKQQDKARQEGEAPPVSVPPVGGKEEGGDPIESSLSSSDHEESPCLQRRYGALAGVVLVLVRVLGAIVNCIADCDETYNYWEPTHYLLYGTGMQTWEYSPLITLRSYAYLLPHALVGRILGEALAARVLTAHDKILVFYGIRVVLGLISAFCEAKFVDGVIRRFGPRAGIYTLLLTCCSAGVFQSSSSFLPSSACAYLVMVVTARWMRLSYFTATFLAVVAVLVLGWPFVALLFAPLALHVFAEMTSTKGVTGFLQVVAWGLASLALVLPPVLLIDHHFYRRWTFPALNILLYNVVGGKDGTGDLLYGQEPASYYIINLLLNLNIVAILAALLPFMAGLALAVTAHFNRRYILSQVLFLSPAYLWLAVMFSRPHKEERFLYPIYPLLCLAAAFSLEHLTAWAHLIIDHLFKGSPDGSGKSSTASNLRRPLLRLVTLASWAVLGLHAALSASRVVSMTRNYTAPLKLFRYLYHALPPTSPSSSQVCVGGEWYRFPASFFLPQGAAHLSFIKSSFGGQLPQPFRPQNGTWDTPLQPFNELNQEEASRYVPLSRCDFLVEFFPDGATKEAVAATLTKHGERQVDRWEVVEVWPFINTDASRSPYRAMYIPGLTDKHVHYGAYTLLQRRKK